MNLFIIQTKRFITILVALTVSLCSFGQKRKYASLLRDGFNLSTSTNIEYNGWSPSESYNLDYKTEGFQTLKFQAVLAHKIPILPDIKFNWETNFNDGSYDDLLNEHTNESQIEEAFNKVMLVVGFGKRYINSKYFDFRNPTSYFQLSYIKETYFIEVSPNSKNIYYQPFAGNRKTFSRNSVLGQYTKFEEIRATFKNDFAFIPLLLQALFTGGSNTDPINVPGRIGVYYNTFNKPYSVTQAISGGSNNGDRNTIYDARFTSYGLYEEYNISDDKFYMNIGLNLGYAELELYKNTVFEDSESPAFLYFASVLEMGWDIEITKKVFLNFSGQLNYSLMYGITGNEKSDQDGEAPLVISSFINNDFRYKLNAGLIINI